MTFFNGIKSGDQLIETSNGCPNGCEYCQEESTMHIFDVPEIKQNYVRILDMNFLAQPQALERIMDLGSRKVNDKVVYYELVCGIDFRRMTSETANLLKQNRFVKIRLAWDYGYEMQFKIKDTIKMLLKAGYKPKELSVFMLVNWKISYVECLKKLDLLKVWNVKVNDCCFDGGYKIAKPEYWTAEQLKDFRARCRKHNQLVNFGIDPELKQKLKEAVK